MPWLKYLDSSTAIFQYLSGDRQLKYEYYTRISVNDSTCNAVNFLYFRPTVSHEVHHVHGWYTLDINSFQLDSPKDIYQATVNVKFTLT